MVELERDPYFLEGSHPGIFFAGDVRHGSIKRVASAVGEGAMAVQLIHRYLAEGSQMNTRICLTAGDAGVPVR